MSNLPQGDQSLNYLFNDPIVQHKIAQLKEADLHISDIVDDAGHQYIDIVLEGGGTLGMALLGYLYTLEQLGIRFLCIGGASAGAIAALLLAAGPIEDAKTEWIIEKVAHKDFYDFVDGDPDSRNFIDNLLKHRHDDPGVFDTLRRAWYFTCIIDNLSSNKKGLNPGTEFHNWIKEILAERGITTYGEMRQMRMKMPQGLRNRATGKPLGDEFNEEYIELGIVAADITTETRVVFPRMGSLYYPNIDQANPADFVRASMSIPLFFRPFEIPNIPTHEGQQDAWRTRCNFYGTIPEKVLFVDGGILSNFPIDIFHDYHKIPSSPTFGVKIGFDRTKCNDTHGFLDYIGAIFWSSAHSLDNEFIHRNPDFKQLVSFIDYNMKRYSWLDFSLDEDEKLELFKRGVETAAFFISNFDWEKYKQSRQVVNG
ncbi:patatin-like phospholipase family protein [uncultured Chitinophaga sp.]|uniref:patatin-like phospholipase family protein n=1 Tax=uncultured Chitinophaga sp. TaxID=339340 RepID=UPI0025ECCAE8|nr:patatin-like phospholipase family protein [uncultured Chitinophaga sp.]